jgi:hypothetical protein
VVPWEPVIFDSEWFGSRAAFDVDQLVVSSHECDLGSSSLAMCETWFWTQKGAELVVNSF